MKEVLSTTNAPGAIGPYSQGISAGNLIITSGQVGINPATGAIPEGVEAQTRQVLDNVKAVLAAGGATMDDVIKTTVFLHDMNDFAVMNAIYGEYFTEGSYPARSAVQVVRLPKDVLVEIEAIAVK